MNTKALTFDIIGTVFDWRSTFTTGVNELNERYGRALDPAAFAQGAHKGYAAGVQAVRRGAPWTPPDAILRASITELLAAERAPAPEEIDECLTIWRRLDPWPGVAQAMRQLHERFTLVILSNVSLPMQAALTEHAGLPFDRMLSAETVRAYKPDPAMYLQAVEALGLAPAEIMMVASHNYDLDAAKTHGFKTAFVVSASDEGTPAPHYDVNAADFGELAAALGAA